MPGAREAVREELHLPAEAKIVLGLGFCDLRKGFDLFLQAARLSAKKGDETVLMGRVKRLPLALSLLTMDAPANYCQAGFTESVSRYLHAADALFLSSREDPFPSVVLEALACGLPAVCFAGRTGSEELIRKHGAVVAAFDIEAAVDALHRLTHAEGEAASAAAVSRRACGPNSTTPATLSVCCKC